MKNFEMKESDLRAVSAAQMMIWEGDAKQVIHFCQKTRCPQCLFEPENYRKHYKDACLGCHQNRLDWLYREAEV